MKTHEVAKVLSSLARALRQAPNVEIEEIGSMYQSESKPRPENQRAVALTTLTELSRIDKKEWQALVHEFDIPVSIRERDASRDILGKVLRHLEKSPNDRERIQKKSASQMSNASPELVKALEFLLGHNN